MRIASWNVNSLKVRLPQLLDWLAQTQPDIVALQETKLEDDRFPAQTLAEAGYQCVFHGQKTYNGVAILARGRELSAVQAGIPGFEDPQARALAASCGALRIINLYVVNGQAVGSEKYAYKLRWIEAAQAWIAAELARHPELIVLGDFNIAPEARDVHDPALWGEHSILTSTAERAALQALLALGLNDSFREFEPGEGHFSWWDYRAAGFRRNLGLRIDLILSSLALRPRLSGAGIDRETRAQERPSDHAPVWLELQHA